MAVSPKPRRLRRSSVDTSRAAKCLQKLLADCSHAPNHLQSASTFARTAMRAVLAASVTVPTTKGRSTPQVDGPLREHQPALGQHRAAVRCRLEPGSKGSLVKLLRDGSHDGQIHAADQFCMFSGQRIEGAVAQHDAATSAVWFVPVLRQSLAGAGKKPIGAWPRAGGCSGLVCDAAPPACPAALKASAGVVPCAAALSMAVASSCPARSYRRSGKITESCRLDRAYSLVGRPAPGPRRSESRLKLISSRPSSASLSRWNFAV